MNKILSSIKSGELEEIGRGSYGIIYKYKGENKVIKFSKNKGQCNTYKNEYKVQKDIYNYYKKYFDENIKKYVRIAKPNNFKSNNQICSFEMEYIDSFKEVVLQGYFGTPEYQYLVDGRGIYLGLKQLNEYFQKIKFKIPMSKIIFNVGYLIGFVQYVCKHTANDTEITIDKNGIIYMIDFGKSEKYIDPDIEILAWSLFSEPYYPREDFEYYDEFESGYLKAAKEGGMEDLALFVLFEMNEK